MAVSAQVPPTVRLVLVHGTRVSGVQWEVHRRWLSPTFDVATPDLPGHGTLAKVPFTMPRAVESVAAAVEGGPAGLPVVLVGHSLGGYVAMEYAAEHPTRLAGLVLIVRGQYDQLGVHAYRYAAAARDARVRTVRGASHLLPLTRPEQTCGIIATFAREVTQPSEGSGALTG